jgi:hypothetical protein
MVGSTEEVDGKNSGGEAAEEGGNIHLCRDVLEGDIASQIGISAVIGTVVWRPSRIRKKVGVTR